MLTALTQQQANAIASNLSFVVDQALNAYEQTQGEIEISAKRKAYKKLYVDLLGNVLNRILEEKPSSIIPLYNQLAFTLVELGFNVTLFVTILVYCQEVLFQSIAQSGGRNAQLENYIERYISEIIKQITQEKLFQKGLKSDQLIQLVEEYAPSFTIEREEYFKDEISERVLHTLIPEYLYWEYQKEQYKEGTSFSTKRLTIYNKRVYSLNQGISQPTFWDFNKEEWAEFNSKFLSKKERFLDKLKNNAEVYVNQVLTNSKDINGIISDSEIKEVKSSLTYDEKDLGLTFAGKGKAVLTNILSLKATVNYFGGYEGSPIGDVDFIANFCEKFYASLYGRVANTGFDGEEGVSLFGRFNSLFLSEEKTNKIAGLNFLNNFKSLRSFKQKLKLPESTLIEDKPGEENIKIISYNPIYAKYKDGIEDKYTYKNPNPYSDEADVDIVLFGIERLLSLTNFVADAIDSLNSSLTKEGLLPGYEGYGPISIEIAELGNVFIPTRVLAEDYQGSKVLPGFNGMLSYLLSSYRRLSDVLYRPPLTSESLTEIASWARKIQFNLEQLNSGIEGIGYLPGSFVPDISFKFSILEKNELANQLRSLSFQEGEIDLFLSAESFEDLLLKFAPITDSKDQISFFRAYELSQLIYEYGGESAIDSYINYLYLQDENNLVNILNFAVKNKSSAVIFNESKYGKLIGLLINLTFAINPDQLQVFKKYLSGNYLDLFESISYLLQNKETNMLLDKDKINLLKPITESLIYGQSVFGYNSNSIDYMTANENAPLALKQWSKLIDKNLGGASTNLIQNLFDKSNGLTPKELISILNTKDARGHNEYEQLIDGYSGGRLTKVINYGYLSGVLQKLSYYSNSYQVPNFFISPENPIELGSLVFLVQNLSTLLDITTTSFVNSLDYKFGQNDIGLYPFENIVNAQNKKPEEFFKIIKGLIPVDGDLTNIGSPKVDGLAEIFNSPGIGNSPVPESIPREKSITPEQANLFSPQIKENFSFIANKESSSITAADIISKFVTFAKDHKSLIEANSEDFRDPSSLSPYRNINNISEKRSNILDNEVTSTLSAENAGTIERVAEIKIPSTYPQETKVQEKIKNSVADGLISEKLIEKFSPLESCKKFGGSKCESRVESNVNSCSTAINKSILSQRDTTSFSPINNNSIIIDRPYGSFSELKPKALFLPYSANNKPAYFKLLGNDLKISDKGIPIQKEIKTDPVIFLKREEEEANESLYASYYNTEYGLIESIKGGFEKDDSFKCSLLEDPYAHLACMNLLKCKRFKRGPGGKFLNFCPKTLSGGLFK